MKVVLKLKSKECRDYEKDFKTKGIMDRASYGNWVPYIENRTCEMIALSLSEEEYKMLKYIYEHIFGEPSQQLDIKRYIKR